MALKSIASGGNSWMNEEEPSCEWLVIDCMFRGFIGYHACLQFQYTVMYLVCSDFLEHVDTWKRISLPVRIHCGILQMQS